MKTAYEYIDDCYYAEECDDKFTEAHYQKIADYIEKRYGVKTTADYVHQVYTELRVNEIYENMLWDMRK